VNSHLNLAVCLSVCLSQELDRDIPSQPQTAGACLIVTDQHCNVYLKLFPSSSAPWKKIYTRISIFFSRPYVNTCFFPHSIAYTCNGAVVPETYQKLLRRPLEQTRHEHKNLHRHGLRVQRQNASNSGLANGETVGVCVRN
jgi:hypothetical protein